MSFVLQNKNVIVLGLGLTGQSCVRFATEQGANVVAWDTRSELDIQLDVPMRLGDFDAETLSQADLLLVSPGIDLDLPALRTARHAGVEMIGDIELFARFNQKTVVGITGSNGKSTVTALVTKMLEADGRLVAMGGNIGTPALELLATDADMLVLELSSFQLETVSSLALEVGCILNISADHLDRHGSLANYQNAKQRIYSHAKHRVCSRDDIATWPLDKHIDTLFGLSGSELDLSWSKADQMVTWQGRDFIDFEQCQLLGEHNVLNVQAAAAIAKLAGASDKAIVSAAAEFSGLMHRCQLVAESKQVRWINDSKATNVGATLAAIDGLASNYSGRIILLAGGDGKKADFSLLAPVFKDHLKALVTFGKDADKLNALFANSCKLESLEAAVQVANSIAQPGDVVILSPACASLDMFRNYQQRGDRFVAAVEALAA